MSIYDASTKKLLFNYEHTLNGRGVPDTLFLDPMRRYDFVIHTLPPAHKNNVQLVVGRHNIIPIDIPQGFIEFICTGKTNYPDLKAVVKVKNKNTTIHSQGFNSKKKYLCGVYEMELLTVPRIYLDSVVVDENKTTTILIPQPGRLQINKSRDLVCAIYRTVNGKTEWVADVTDEFYQTIIMQPGKYTVIGRSKAETRTIYTFNFWFLF